MIPKRAHFKTLLLKTYLKIDKKVIKLKDMSLQIRIGHDQERISYFLSCLDLWPNRNETLGTSETSSADDWNELKITYK